MRLFVLALSAALAGGNARAHPGHDEDGGDPVPSLVPLFFSNDSNARAFLASLQNQAPEIWTNAMAEPE